MKKIWGSRYNMTDRKFILEILIYLKSIDKMYVMTQTLIDILINLSQTGDLRTFFVYLNGIDLALGLPEKGSVGIS